MRIKLDLIEYEYMLKPVRVMVTRDYGELVIDGEAIQLQKGVEAELPYWLAKIFENKGVANTLESAITIEDIARVHFSVVSARTPADLEPLPRNFYLEALRYIKRLDEEIRRNFNAELLEEKQKAIQYLLEIIDKRLLLILQSMRSPTSLAEISSKLSEEEAILMEELRRILDLWKKKLSPLP